MNQIVLKMEHIVKEFPGVRALNEVNFEARAGEVLALMGENGAGKSTLMKVLSGVWPYPTYKGDIHIDGQLKRFANTREAEDAGIAIIYQELNLIPELSVAENIFLDRQFLNSFGFIDWARLNAEAQLLLDEIGVTDIKPTDPVKTLTVGKQQIVEITKALSKRSRILVLDEPTSALTNREVTDLFRIIRKLKADGVCMCYISHKMEEIQQIADRIVVLRDGQTIGDEAAIEDITLNQIITRMVGRDIQEMFPKRQAKRGAKMLEVRNFSVAHPLLPDTQKVRNASFCAYAGEILGISGLMGAGRTELMGGIFGAFPGQTRGEIYIEGKKATIRSPADAIKAGIALLTEDRKALGLFLDQSIVFNTTISSLDTISSKTFGVIDPRKEERIVRDYFSQLNVRASGIDAIVGTLSGGNQQKVNIAKWLAANPKIFILDEPTRGIDIGAKVEIYKMLNEIADRGVAVIVISSELPEIMGVSDRILIMCEGSIVSEISRGEASRETIMEYATGARIGA
jgi:D-xylose transport system ATP-binding protein